MAFTNPTTPNLPDFISFVASNGITSANLPSGSLGTVTIDTSGNLTATSITGTVVAGMVLTGTGLSDGTYLSTFNSGTMTGTVSPSPSVAVSDPTVSVWSAYLWWSLNQAESTVLPPPPFLVPIIWVLATYNLGLHILIRIAQDETGQTFFQNLRTKFNIGSFVSGVLANATDEGTGAQLVVAEAFKNLSLANLDCLKTPYGREYLMYIQEYGPTIVGVC